MKNKIPIILCAGKNGAALIFGWVDEEPTPGEPVTLYNAKMILYYPDGGTFGLAASGPPKGSRVTRTVPKTVETAWQEWMLCTDEAAEARGG